MLMLTRRAGQTVRIGDSVEITIVAVEGGKVRIGVNAPRALPVHRGEVVARAVEDN
ncbi:MAG: carbon storage regulator CsrA, partial [Sandaracinaceae bacterium]|nr:carbon storage regulator CsrA [Sandaracinaceae bacterium]